MCCSLEKIMTLRLIYTMLMTHNHNNNNHNNHNCKQMAAEDAPVACTNSKVANIRRAKRLPECLDENTDLAQSGIKLISIFI